MYLQLDFLNILTVIVAKFSNGWGMKGQQMPCTELLSIGYYTDSDSTAASYYDV